MFFNIHKNFVAGNTTLGAIGLQFSLHWFYNPLNKQKMLFMYNVLKMNLSIIMEKNDF